MWGREAFIDELTELVSTRAGGLIVDITAPLGTGAARLAHELHDRLAAIDLTSRLITAEPTAASRPGETAAQVGAIDHPEKTSVVIVGAEHADATSLGLLSRDVAGGMALILFHAPVSGPAALALAKLRAAAPHMIERALPRLTAADVATGLDLDLDAARLLLDAAGNTDEGLTTLLEELSEHDLGSPTALESVLTDLATRSQPSLAALDEADRVLVEAAVTTGRSLSVRTLAELAGLDERAILNAADRLARDGYLTETATGFGPPPEARRTEIAGSIGPARRGYVRESVAGAMEASGDAKTQPATVGLDYFAAERWEDAARFIVPVAVELAQQGALAEAYPLLSAAIRCHENGAAVDDSTLSSLLLARARYFRESGFPDRAVDDLQRASTLASGATRVDILGFLGAVLDDRQLPQDAATIVATAQWEAARQGFLDKLGSLLTFQGRELERLGFASEADRAVDVGTRLVDRHGQTTQRINAKSNRAWIAFDRGRARHAEQLFAELVDLAPPADPGARAYQQVWHARALFAAGTPSVARSTLAAAFAGSEPGSDHVIRFLGAVATQEGAVLYGQWETALAATEAEEGLVTLLLSDWRNGTLYRRAQALAGLGRWDEAAETNTAAAEHTPAGANGYRWARRIDVQRRIIDHARTGSWDTKAAASITDELLVAQWFGVAVDLMIARTSIERSPELGIDAAALAMQLGNPVKAAEAIHAAHAWDRPEAGPVVRAVAAVDRDIPEDWADGWRNLSHVAAALQANPPEAEDTLLDDRLNEALTAAGLANSEAVYSPAQRAALGLGLRRPARRRLSTLAMAGIAAAVVVVATIAGFVGSSFRSDPEPTIVTVAAANAPASAPTTTTTLPLIDRPVPVPAELVGQAPYLGGADFTGVYDATGVPDLKGQYWSVDTGGPTRSAPVVLGNSVIFGGGDGFVWSVETDGSNGGWRQPMSASIDAPVAVGELRLGGATTLGTTVSIVAADTSGQVVAYRTNGGVIWTADAGGPVTAAPVITEDYVVVATTDGEVVGLSAGEGTEAWRYPGPDDEPIGSIHISPVSDGDTVYVASGEFITAIDATTGEFLCNSRAAARASAPGTVADGFVFSPFGPVIHIMATDTCTFRTDGGRASIPMNIETVTSPAIVDDIMYVGSGQLLTAFSIIDGIDYFTAVPLDSRITGSPIVAGDVVYTSTANRELVALDRHTGEILWRVQADGIIDAPVAVIDDAVFVLTADGTLIALGG